jgi:hypothetical protein
MRESIGIPAIQMGVPGDEKILFVQTFCPAPYSKIMKRGLALLTQTLCKMFTQTCLDY